jgi:titin
LTVSWAAATAGDNPADIYKVEIVEVQEGGMANVTPLCEVPAATLTCSGPAEPGRAHEVVVYAVDTAGDMGVMSARVASGVVPFLATPPAKNGDLVLPAGASSTVAPGTTMTVSGTGYAPFSRVTVLIYSEPQVLKVVIADVNGAFTVEVTVPAGLAVGQHTLVASGLDANGVLRYVSLPVTVSVDSTGATTAKLAATGADVALPLAGGLAALALGGGLIVASRRRSAA